MSRCTKLEAAARNNPAGLTFSEACRLAECIGYTLVRINGSHHIYKRPNSRDINLQNRKGQAKEFQVKQILDIIDGR